MRNTRLMLAIGALALLWSTTIACHAASDLSRNGERLKSVSMIELIANPEKFDGVRVIVSGFVHFEFEGNAIYLHEEYYHDNLWQNGIALGVTLQQRKQNLECASRYCYVIGTFHAIRPHYFSLWSGSLNNITVFHILGPVGNKSTSSQSRVRNRVIGGAELPEVAKK